MDERNLSIILMLKFKLIDLFENNSNRLIKKFYKQIKNNI